ncbi:MAG: GntR family transcriptional regulator [Chloroflexi bacterium]|nr:GntR family transcriptional regulator [Chloroflexota bacterium]MCL5075405.1 GntR family transcriptional regulator [Chloroflexota bacterium]
MNRAARTGPLVDPVAPSSRLLKQRAYEIIKEKIINCELKPGNPIVEGELAAALGVSRTPIREALQQLQDDGLVILAPHKGAYISDLDVDDVTEIFQIREALEGMVARLAAERITPDSLAELEKIVALLDEAIRENSVELAFKADNQFHALLLETAGNRRASRIIHKLNGQIHRLRFISASIPSRIPVSMQEHKDIAQAIKSRDAHLAEQLMKHHIRQTYNNVVQLIKSPVGAFLI